MRFGWPSFLTFGKKKTTNNIGPVTIRELNEDNKLLFTKYNDIIEKENEKFVSDPYFENNIGRAKDYNKDLSKLWSDFFVECRDAEMDVNGIPSIIRDNDLMVSLIAHRFKDYKDVWEYYDMNDVNIGVLFKVLDELYGQQCGVLHPFATIVANMLTEQKYKDLGIKFYGKLVEFDTRHQEMREENKACSILHTFVFKGADANEMFIRYLYECAVKDSSKNNNNVIRFKNAYDLFMTEVVAKTPINKKLENGVDMTEYTIPIKEIVIKVETEMYNMFDINKIRSIVDELLSKTTAKSIRRMATKKFKLEIKDGMKFVKMFNNRFPGFLKFISQLTVNKQDNTVKLKKIDTTLTDSVTTQPISYSESSVHDHGETPKEKKELKTELKIALWMLSIFLVAMVLILITLLVRHRRNARSKEQEHESGVLMLNESEYKFVNNL
ncbi:hypothetical protein ECANGB1_1927 [Enterospora canceri]|uniref:Uncharacterized protein n=1 Tax=Enterospora canceri TaxID=1081671 RepID=A0A1Y1S5C0_9MICR|nr:hypothetical protein ECANGB1_1927 [Enterospora canceri]